MNKLRLMIGIALVSMAMVSCDKNDNPVEQSTITLDDPQEEVSDQPATARPQ